MTLRWDNGQGLSFAKRLELDSATTCSRSSARVTNSSDKPVTLYPYGLISRWGTPPTLGYYILHEGPIGVLDGKLRGVEVHGTSPRRARSTSTAPAAGSASPTNTGWPRWCRSRTSR